MLRPLVRLVFCRIVSFLVPTGQNVQFLTVLSRSSANDSTSYREAESDIFTLAQYHFWRLFRRGQRCSRFKTSPTVASTLEIDVDEVAWSDNGAGDVEHRPNPKP